eukprot:TRINITY_DN46678_c0_g1_i4.p1 TRINITY_DN46678_c0_g1~~TRINITY_DN46678_c0_g1_i4.p1  ORF type:complete len:626 (+),score=119.11 TRINITY_DN46678_c0_g1_i4:209-2086(+)
MRTIALPCVLGAVCLLSAKTAAERSSQVVIGSAADITRCLGMGDDDSLTLQNCLDGKGARWAEPATTGNKELQLFNASDTVQGCVSAKLEIGKCGDGHDVWSWNPATLQLEVDLGHHKECLEKVGDSVKLEPCKMHDGSQVEQNGEGAPAEQTWVLFPAVRPQLDILDTIDFPLRASGSHFIDSTGKTVKLVGVNWFGAHMGMLVNNGLGIVRMEQIAKSIKHMGFNSVRMNYASWMHEKDEKGEFPKVPKVEPSLCAANPDLEGLSAMEVFDKSIEAVTKEGLLVILNRHMGKPGWCCNPCDGSQLWYGDGYTKEDWLDSLTFMADRYKNNKRVVAFDILNEPRSRQSDGAIGWWGLDLSFTAPLGFQFRDWRQAAAQGAVATWKGNPDQVVIVEGVLYASLLQGITTLPMKIAQDCLKSRLAYSSHNYHWFWQGYRLFSHLFDEFNLLYLVKDLKDIVTVMNAANTETGSTSEDACSVAHNEKFPNGGAELASFERFADARNKSVFWVANTETAPVWVSEFGTPSKQDNTWWKYLMRYFKEYNINWCYWSIDPIKTPAGWEGQEEALRDDFAIFDSHRKDYKAVVGWKLQDLIAVKRLRAGLDEAQRLGWSSCAYVCPFCGIV